MKKTINYFALSVIIGISVGIITGHYQQPWYITLAFTLLPIASLLYIRTAIEGLKEGLTTGN